MGLGGLKKRLGDGREFDNGWNGLDKVLGIRDPGELLGHVVGLFAEPRVLERGRWAAEVLSNLLREADRVQRIVQPGNVDVLRKLNRWLNALHGCHWINDNGLSVDGLE